MQKQYKNFFIKPIKIDSKIINIAKRKFNITKIKTQEHINQLGNILVSYALYYIKGQNPGLTYKEHYSFIDTNKVLPHFIMTIIITRTNTNHPYMVFANINTDYIYFFIPFGNGTYQVDFVNLDKAIEHNELTRQEAYALSIFLQQNILVRKNTMLKIDQFSLLNCRNISNCVRKMNEIKRMRVSLAKKKELQAHYNTFYQEKAVKFLMKYFTMLENEDYQEAFLFLRGEKGKYKGKERLNTFFKNSKQIVGHLQIFISLYKYMFNLKKLSIGY